MLDIGVFMRDTPLSQDLRIRRIPGGHRPSTNRDVLSPKSSSDDKQDDCSNHLAESLMLAVLVFMTGLFSIVSIVRVPTSDAA